MKNKSVAQSTSGKFLMSLSTIILFAGIFTALILVFASFIVDNTSIMLISAVEVLICSIFFFAFGKTFASIANYVEAIYKNVNPDFDKDEAYSIKNEDQSNNVNVESTPITIEGQKAKTLKSYPGFITSGAIVTVVETKGKNAHCYYDGKDLGWFELSELNFL